MGNLSTEVRKQFITTYIWGTVLCRSETWTMTATEKARIEAFEMWCYRRVMRINGSTELVMRKS